jgi:hypothetical protein
MIRARVVTPRFFVVDTEAREIIVAACRGCVEGTPGDEPGVNNTRISSVATVLGASSYATMIRLATSTEEPNMVARSHLLELVKIRFW